MTRHFLAASLALTAALGGVAVSQHKHGNTTAYADLGETERALDALELAFRQRSTWPWIGVDP